MPLLTVFTPAYNRGYNIEALYESLARQTYKDFEWLIINDGSTDDTLGKIRAIMDRHDGSFPIRLVSRENRGLPRTINEGLDNAEGVLFWRLDSDDLAKEDAVELVHKYYPLISDNPKLCAIVFLSLKSDRSVNGYHPFDKVEESDFTFYRVRHKAVGDRAEVMKTAVYRDFKFPIYGEERFCNEALVWNRIAKEYGAVYIPEGIYIKQDACDSITADLYKWLRTNCKGTAQSYVEMVADERLPYGCRWYSAVQYYRFAWFAGSPLWKGLPKKVALVAAPFGLAAFLRDRIKY